MSEKILDPATEQEQMLVAEYTDLKTQIAAIDAEDIAAMNPGEKKYYENKLARKAFLASRLKMHGLLFEVEDEEETLAAPTISPSPTQGGEESSSLAVALSHEDEEETLAAPTISPSPTQGGEESSSLAVALSHEDEEASIYYTTDGETPTSESTLYDTSFSIANTDAEAKQVTVKAIAIKSGVSSEVASATYTLAAAAPAEQSTPGAE